MLKPEISQKFRIQKFFHVVRQKVIFLLNKIRVSILDSLTSPKQMLFIIHWLKERQFPSLHSFTEQLDKSQ